MRKILFVLSLLCMALCGRAQDVRDEFRNNPCLSASNLVAYPGPRKPLTPAPKGYKPFYLSHYGRHGSRYLIGGKDYDAPYRTLLRADSLGKLTARGKELLSRVSAIRLEAMGRDGELTPLGARQHRDIARRMYERFPQVFKGNATVDAKSTVVIRCILSMENALQQLLRLNPELIVTHDASNHDMYYMNQTDTMLYNQKLAGGTKELIDSFRHRHQQYGELMKVVFNDAGYVDGIDASEFALQLFKLAGNVQSTELRHNLTLYDYFTPEELYSHWLCHNAFWYLTYGPSRLNGGNQPFTQRNLLRKMIDEADSCMALPHPGATLRYGHDTMVMPLACLLNLDGYGNAVDDVEHLAELGWCDYRIFPMACNVQMVFYRRNVTDKDILVKVLFNEDEAALPLFTDSAPYYRWSDVRSYYLSKLAGYMKE